MANPGQMIAIPGQLLGPSSQLLPGPGTHVYESNVYASLLGTVQISRPAASTAPAAKHNAAAAAHQPGPLKRPNKIVPPTTAPPPPSALPTVSVLVSSPSSSSRPGEISESGSGSGSGNARREVLPDVGDTVLCRVARITPKQAVVAILVCGETVLEAEWQGVIRMQDVRATEKDRVRIPDSFRPGDIVRAEVISLGDQANYYLSTARNELGVIMATSDVGNAMFPVSWKEFKDPETGASESRKVARPA